jgi:Flagellin and related hook-associated proteins
VFSGSANLGPADKDGTKTAMTPTALTSAVALASTNTATQIDTAITEVTGLRGTLGANINQLEYRINNYSNISANTASALSAVKDADFAAESSNLAKFQILQQAGTAMLAQANASQQTVLALLQ